MKRNWDGWERERAFKRGRRDDAGHGTGKAVPLAGAVDRWIREHNAGKKLREADVLERWAELVGESVAAQATPQSLKKGKLVLRVQSSTWRHQLLYMRKELIASINAGAGETIVREIVFTG